MRCVEDLLGLSDPIHQHLVVLEVPGHFIQMRDHGFHGQHAI